VSAQVIRSGTSTLAGGSLEYSVWVWSNTKATRVSATVERSSQSILAPAFSLCPAARGNTCSIGSIPPNQAFELVITDRIAKSAIPGQQLTVTVAVQAASMSPAEVSITMVVGERGSSSPEPIVTVPSEPTTVPGLPGTTVTPGSIGSLFPEITPSSTPSPARGGGTQPKRKSAKFVATASSLPLDPRLIGGQVIGLAVLAAAITMVVARLSLRTPQPSTAGASTTAAAPPAEPAEKPEPKPEKQDEDPAE
jgi:hypothetical protein